MKKALFAIAALYAINSFSQPIVEIGAGYSTSQYIGLLNVGYASETRFQSGVLGMASDQMRMVGVYSGYNFAIGEVVKLNVNPTLGYITHNVRHKDSGVIPKSSTFIPMLFTSLDFHYSRIGAVAIGGFASTKVHGAFISLKAYINK